MGGALGAGLAMGAGQGVTSGMDMGVKMQMLDLQKQKIEGEKKKLDATLKQKQMSQQLFMSMLGQMAPGLMGGQAPAMAQAMASPSPGGIGQPSSPAEGEAQPTTPGVVSSGITEEDIGPSAPGTTNAPQRMPQVGVQAQRPTTGQPGASPMKFIPSITFDTDGEAKLTFGGKEQNYQVRYEDIHTPQGMQKWRIVDDPATGQSIDRRPMGTPKPSDAVARFNHMAAGFGAPVGTPMNAEVSEMIAAADAIPDPQARTAALGQIQGQVQATIGKAGIDVEAARKAGRRERMGERTEQFAQEQGVRIKTQPQIEAGTTAANLAVQTQLRPGLEAATTEATVGARTRTEPLRAAESERFQTLSSVERVGTTVQSLFKPEYVGKGFQGFGDAFKAEFEKASGDAVMNRYNPATFLAAARAALRQYSGNISPEEVNFRRSFIDLSDQLLRARSKSQTTEKEYERLKEIIGSFSDEPKVFKAGLDRFVNETGSQIEDLLKASTTPAAQIKQERKQGKVTEEPIGPVQVSPEANAKIAIQESGYIAGKVGATEFLKFLQQTLGDAMGQAYFDDVNQQSMGASPKAKKKGK